MFKDIVTEVRNKLLDDESLTDPVAAAKAAVAVAHERIAALCARVDKIAQTLKRFGVVDAPQANVCVLGSSAAAPYECYENGGAVMYETLSFYRGYTFYVDKHCGVARQMIFAPSYVLVASNGSVKVVMHALGTKWAAPRALPSTAQAVRRATRRPRWGALRALYRRSAR